MTEATLFGAPSRSGASPFQQLHDLQKQLPAMEQKSHLLKRAREVEDVLRHKNEHQRALVQLHEAQAGEQVARDEFEKAAARSFNEGIIEACRARLLQAGTQLSLRVGPAKNAQRALEEALKQAGFASVEEAQASQTNPRTIAQWEREIQAYQESYFATLSLCEGAVDTDVYSE